jgi:hypothetical protein
LPTVGADLRTAAPIVAKGAIMNESRFRWVGRPSEEELLGLPATGTGRANAFRPTPPAPRVHRVSAIAVHAQRHPLRTRNLIVVAAVAAAAALAFGVAHRGPPSEPGPAVPTVAVSAVVRAVAPDRTLGPRPGKRTTTRGSGREQALVTPHVENPPAPSGDETSAPSGDETSAGSEGDDDATPTRPPAETSDEPLLEATISGVGTVTVEEPKLPDPEQVLGETSPIPVP